MTEQPARDDLDSPWKEALEHHFPEFLALLFAPVHRRIDWSRGHQFLDKELQQVVRDAELGRRYADKLVQVHTFEGTDAWVLVHVEVQSRPEPGFDRRMYVYNYRLFDRYGVDVVSLAVLADESPGFRAGRYRRSLWGCELRFRFPTVKLLELGRDPAALESSTNPFALVVLAHLRAQQSRSGEERKYWKLHLIRLMLRRGYGREQLLELFRVIDWIIRLPDGLEQEFARELAEIEEGETMPYVTSMERFGIEAAEYVGMKKGRLEGERTMLLRQLDRKFGAQLTDAHRAEVAGADSDTLLRWSENILTAGVVDEVFG